MTVTAVDRTTWTQVSTGAARLQVFGGRVRIAASGAPAAGDYHVWPDGSVVDVASVKYAQAVDDTDTRVVSQAP